MGGSSQKQKLMMMILGFVLICQYMEGAFGDGGGKEVYDAEKYCKTADKKELCAEMVKGAQSLREAKEKAIKATMEFAKKIEGQSGEVLPSGSEKKLPAETRKSIAEACKDSFKNAVADLELSLKALKDHDKGTLMTRLSAALDGDCEDAVSEFGVNFPLQKEMKRFDAEVDNTLAVVTQK